MSEKSFLCFRTGIWLQAIAWILIVLYSLKTIFLTWLLLDTVYDRLTVNATEEQAWQEALADLGIEDYPSLLSMVSELLFFIIAFIIAITMAGILLKGYKQRNVRFLKAWIVFAVLAVLSHILFLVLSLGEIVVVIAMIIYVPLYAPSVWITNLHINSIVGEQHDDGDNLPRYEVHHDDVL
ncbi:unnamed protein product [Allacma fusca]|uniref:Uncharacterized protein n=1 Tax=Allacma fusca TaxID=39272 RepID=A0A8J2LR85_9HEXA|nr:unnamed protein product [Allacma fusca]